MLNPLFSDNAHADGVLLGSALDRAAHVPRPADRMIGVEMELGNLSVQQAADVVQEMLGGARHEHQSNVIRIEGSDIGEITVELDADLLQGSATESHVDGASIQHKALALAGDLSTGVVPVEIVAPPVPLSELEILDDLAAKLREAGATGTGDSMLAGFGLHLNPEETDLSAKKIVRILRAFLLLEDTLWADSNVDPTRMILPFISKFPDGYALKLIAPSYEPDMAGLIDDYLEANDTRNRDLDLLPLFAHIDAERVKAQNPDPLIKARPTYHYRLPNCDLDQPNWSVVREWRRWACVETLADDEVMLTTLSRAYVQAARDGLLADWHEIVAEALR